MGTAHTIKVSTIQTNTGTKTTKNRIIPTIAIITFPRKLNILYFILVDQPRIELGTFQPLLSVATGYSAIGAIDPDYKITK